MTDIRILDLAEPEDGDIFARRDDDEYAATARSEVHVFRGHVCDTDSRGHHKSGLELVLDANEGFIPLWEPNVTLRWRFQDRSLARFRYPEQVKEAVRQLLHAAIAAWGEAAPIRFSEQSHACDFEIAVREADNCSPLGCTLASAFFPDQGQHELTIYPLMFSLDAEEQVETMAHEIGHVFGLRHFFAQSREAWRPSEIFGEHDPISIMNYGDQSRLTPTDLADLRKLYELVWAGQLKDINRTPIRLMSPFSANRT